MEKLMQYVWQHKLWLPQDMVMTDGRHVKVIDQGMLNTGAGPDFFNAKIAIDGNVWAGNIEIHVRASDWHRHGHDSDPAYDSVVLHVVQTADTAVQRSTGEAIPQIEMKCAADFSDTYHRMVNNPISELPCAHHIASLEKIYITDWVTRLAFERLQTKAARTISYLDRCGGDWGQAIYVTLARAMGFSTNSEPFERLALATPLRKLMRHGDSLVTIEGALFGQAGLLGNLDAAIMTDHYVQRMVQEYDFVKHKYGLATLSSPGWKMGRMRPQNFPHRRLSLLAHFIADGFSIGNRLLGVKDLAGARALFDIDMTGYWSRRYTFGAEACRTVKALSDSSVNTLVINVVAPVLYAFGSACGQPDMCDNAVEILQQLPPEDNSLVRIFTLSGIECPDAFTSQALIQLRREYCLTRKCLYCRIGHRYLAAKALKRQDGMKA